MEESGKDYTEHSALTNFLETPDDGINRAIVFSNERELFTKKGVTLNQAHTLGINAKTPYPSLVGYREGQGSVLQ